MLAYYFNTIINDSSYNYLNINDIKFIMIIK